MNLQTKIVTPMDIQSPPRGSYVGAQKAASQQLRRLVNTYASGKYSASIGYETPSAGLFLTRRGDAARRPGDAMHRPNTNQIAI